MTHTNLRSLALFTLSSLTTLAGCSEPSPTHEPLASASSAQVVDLAGAFWDWGTVCTVGGTTMHCCPPGSAMIGAHVDHNVLKCAPMNNPTGVRSLDTGTVRNDMHVCPLGQVMVGLHADFNQLACQTIPNNPITAEWVDYGTADTYPMHVCTSTNPALSRAAMTGIRIDRNELSCGTNPDFIPPLPPTNLAVTSTDPYWIYLSWKDNNPPDTNVFYNVHLYERLSNGQEVLRGDPGHSGPAGGINTGAFPTSSLAGGQNSCVKILLTNAFGTTMRSNLACAPAMPPPNPVGAVGLGNGVHVTNGDMTDWNYYPTAFDDFRIAWHVCNTKSTDSGPLDVQLREYRESTLEETYFMPLNGVPAGSCVLQYTGLITTFSTSYWHWDVYINGAFMGGTGMTFSG